MKKPQVLQPGDRVEIVVPASPVRPEFFEKGVEVLRGLGLRVTFGNVYRRWRYMAGHDQERTTELLNALNDPEIKAIFVARGGYGSGRLVSHLDIQEESAKIVLGCSDITSLHQYFQEMQNWVVFHGPMPSGDFARGQLHEESLRMALMQTSAYALSPENIQTLIHGNAEGILKGGCLTVLESTLGTPWEPDWQDAILFLEDVSAKPYQIDRMLTHLKTIGKFKDVRAFIFGEMKDCFQVENQGYTLQEVILDILSDLGVPIFFGFPSGHVSGANWTIPLGIHARINTSPFRLEFLEGAVQ